MSELVAGGADPAPSPAPEAAASDRRRRLTHVGVLCFVLLMALGARVAVHHVTPTWTSADSVRYYNCATAFHEDWRKGLAYMEDWTPPLVVFVWSAVLRTGESYRPAIVLNHALGLLSAGLVCWTLLRMSGPVLALLGGLPLALSPQVLFMERWLVRETLHLFLVCLTCTLAVHALRRPRTPLLAALGGALGLAWLTKSSGIALAALPAAGTLLLFRSIAAGKVRPVRAGAALLGAFALVILPWQSHVWRTYGSLSATPNTKRNFLLCVADSGLFDAEGGHTGNRTLMREVGAVLDPNLPISVQGWTIVNHLTTVHGRGGPSERVAQAITREELRRKPGEYARRVMQTCSFLLGLSASGASEPHEHLDLAWSGHAPLTELPAAYAGEPPARGSPRAQELLRSLHRWENPVHEVALLLGLLGVAGACLRGAGRWRWGLFFGLPLLAVVVGHSQALGASRRYVFSYLPLALLGAATPFAGPPGRSPVADEPPATAPPVVVGPPEP